LLTLSCAIEQIAEWHPQMFLDSQIVACVTILEEYSTSPASFAVECTDIQAQSLGQMGLCSLEVSWSAETAAKAERLRLTLQRKPLVEAAATAIALILAHELTELEDLDVTEYGDRADYRSLSKPCVLEISGTESLAELPRRHRQKVAQALANRYSWDAYASVCAFSAQGHRVRFSMHSHSEG
jgi:hypothetical protein